MREKEVLEIRRTRGSEGGEHLRITESLHSSPDNRHLWIAEEINCKRYIYIFFKRTKISEMVYDKRLMKKFELYFTYRRNSLTCRQIAGTEANSIRETLRRNWIPARLRTNWELVLRFWKALMQGTKLNCKWEELHGPDPNWCYWVCGLPAQNGPPILSIWWRRENNHIHTILLSNKLIIWPLWSFLKIKKIP